MKKYKILLLLLLPLCLQAQVNISIQLPPAGLVRNDQLWNLVLMNTGNNIIDVTLSMNLREAVSGQTVLSANTGTVILGKGVKAISVQDIQPVQYNYISGNPSGTYLPAGSYIACYQASRPAADGVAVIANECVRININPLSPPLLNLPADQSVIEDAYPQFSWVPPTPAEMLGDLSYDILMAEVLEGQSPAEALLNNQPVYTNHYLKVPYEVYPSTFSKLEPGRKYAWQVRAVSSNQYNVNTDVWTFAVKQKDSVKADIGNINYLLLKKASEPSGINYIEGDHLYIKYYSFDREWKADVKFVDAEGQVVSVVRQTIIYGDNFFDFKINKSFKEQQVYKLLITDDKNNESVLLFSIKRKN